MSGADLPRNPGPSWGYRFLNAADRLLPYPLMRAALWLGTWFALPVMPEQRRASLDYLRTLTGRSVGLRAVHRHFFALMENLWTRLRVGGGREHHFHFAENNPHTAFEALARSPEPVIFGSLHVGQSDLLGCFLRNFGRRVHVIRLRVANAYDQEQLAARFADSLRFIWVNEPRELFFALKESLDSGAALALQCDRVEFGTRHAGFRFLGADRLFPVTIYHLAYLYRRPVVFAFSFPSGRDCGVVHAGPILPPPTGNREDYFARAHAHFQQVLYQLETLLREHPYQWFNFTRLNPETGDHVRTG